MQIHALTTLALLLLSILLGATIARPRGMGPGEDMVGLLANPMIGLPDYGDPEGLINISPDMLLQTLGGETGAAGELGEQMPLVPENICVSASPAELPHQNYMRIMPSPADQGTVLLIFGKLTCATLYKIVYMET